MKKIYVKWVVCASYMAEPILVMLIQVPKPCSASWEDMQPVKEGRHCASCDKMVVDFTAMKDDEVLRYFLDSADHVCGRFQKGQLDRALDAPVTEPSRMRLLAIEPVRMRSSEPSRMRLLAIEPVRHRFIFRNWLLALGWQSIVALAFGCGDVKGKVVTKDYPRQQQEALNDTSGHLVHSLGIPIVWSTVHTIIGDTGASVGIKAIASSKEYVGKGTPIILGNSTPQEILNQTLPFDTSDRVNRTSIRDGGGPLDRAPDSDTTAPLSIRMGGVAIGVNIWNVDVALKVVDKNGKPISGATIRPANDTSKDELKIGVTDSEGIVHINIPAGAPKQSYIIRSNGYKDEHVRFSSKSKRIRPRIVKMEEEDEIIAGGAIAVEVNQ
jgi:hypothetical protein